MTSVRYDHATRTYDGTSTPAVDDLDLDIGDGELLVLVGPSGSGKSTALRMLAGLEPLNGGSLHIGDRDVSNVRPRDRDIAMVFQNYALYPQLTVAENMGFALKQQRVPKQERIARVREAARVLDIEPFLDRKPKHLSGGQRQRVAMGRAIVRRPAVFLMDEPLSNLDAKLRVQMRAEIARIQREVGVTTIYVTHDQVEAMTMGDRVAVMRKGELQQMADPQTLYDSPNNLFVASFIGSPAMNIVEADVERDGGSLALRIGDQQMAVPDDVAARRPALAGYAGRKLAVGIRPEHIEDASLARNGGARLRGKVLLTEALGSEILAHVEMKASPVLTEDVVEAAVYEAEEAEVMTDLLSETEGRTTFVGRFDPASRVKPDSEVELAVDTKKLQFFDLDTGFSIRESAVAG
jgi:multiple sugar transport system ATP-binding protein